MLDDGVEVNQITVYLKRLSEGDSSAEAPLAEAVYDHLRVTAHQLFGSSGSSGTLQPTALVNIVLLELIRLRSINWQDRKHFFCTASRMLRRRFIDSIRSRKAGKRPQDVCRVDLEDCLMPIEERFDEILDVHKALEGMAILDPDLAELVEMVYFGGCPIQTAAEIRGVSTKTIIRHLKCAKGYLRERLGCLMSPEEAAITSEE